MTCKYCEGEGYVEDKTKKIIIKCKGCRKFKTEIEAMLNFLINELDIRLDKGYLKTKDTKLVINTHKAYDLEKEKMRVAEAL